MAISKKVMGLAASGVLIMAASPVVGAIAAENPAEANAAGAEAAAQADFGQYQVRKVADVEGRFAWSQDTVATNAYLAKHLYNASKFLCGGQNVLDVAAAVSGQAITQIKVSGDVAHEFIAEVSEFEKSDPVKKIMGCTCAGNPEDGMATANALVTGFTLQSLVNAAAPGADVNAITFISADGYQVTLPLSYVMQRYSVIVTGLNGEPMAEAVGHQNQLWLGAVSARCFASDIVEIRLTAEVVAPPMPGTDAYVAANVGITNGSAA